MYLQIENFNTLYRTYYAALCYFSLKIVADADSAEDIVNEVFEELLKKRQKFTASDNLKAYLYTATKNASLDYLKKELHLKERQWKFNSNQLAEEPAYINEMIRAEVLRDILTEIHKLPGHSGRIIELSYFEGLKNDEIARQLNLSLQTVKNLKSLGLTTLKSRLSPDLFLLFLLASESILYVNHIP